MAKVIIDIDYDKAEIKVSDLIEYLYESFYVGDMLPVCDFEASHNKDK